MLVQMQISTLKSDHAFATLAIGEKGDEYQIALAKTHATVVFDRKTGVRVMGKTFHDTDGRGAKEVQIETHYKRHGKVLAEAIREITAMMRNAN